MSLSRKNRRENSPEKEAEDKRIAVLEATAETERTASARIISEKIISAEKSLRHPEIPEALKGIEGLKEAHKILCERKERGILIGGLAEAIWSSKNSGEDLSSHKDVDILILHSGEGSEELQEKHNESFKNFYGGIDWWVPKQKILPVSGPLRNNVAYNWYENGHGIILPYRISVKRDWVFSRGLYLPPPEFVLSMREFGTQHAKEEADRLRDKSSQGEDYIYFDGNKFREELRQNLKEQLKNRVGFDGTIASDIAKNFEDSYILEDAGINDVGASGAIEKTDPHNINVFIEALTLEEKQKITELRNK